MAILQIAMRDHLQGDAFLTDAPPSGLGFGIYSKWLVAPTNWDRPEAGTTPEAFDRTKGGRLKRSIVITDGGEVAHPGPSGGSTIRRWDAFPHILIIAEAHQTGKEAITAAKLRIEELLVPWLPVIAGNQTVSFLPADDRGLEESEGFPGNMVLDVRWRATGARTFASA